MPAPLITITNAASATLSSLAFNPTDAGSTSNTINILVWNNQGGSQVLSDATSATITTKTFNGYDTGDTVPNGQEVVSNLMLNIKCTSQGDSAFTAVGGETTAPIGNSTVGTIKGSIGGTSAAIATQVVAISNVTAGTAQWLTRVAYIYS